MKLRKYIVVHNGHPNDRIAFECIENRTNKLDIDLFEFDISKVEGFGALADMIVSERGNIEAVLAFSFHIFQHLYRPDFVLHEELSVPLVVFIMDHPAHEMQKIPPKSSNTLFVFGCVEHQEYWRAQRGDDDNTSVAACWFATERVKANGLDFDTYLSRENHIFAPMNLSFFGRKTDDWWSYVEEFPEPHRGIIKASFSMIAQDQTLDLDLAIEAVLKDKSVELDVQQLNMVTAAVDGIAKIWRRNFIISKLINLPILVSTDHVPEVFLPKFQDKFIKTSDYNTLIQYQHFRYILNVSSATPGLVHDRVVNCVEAEATLISDANNGISELFSPVKEFVSLDFETENIAENVSTAMDNPRASYDMAQSAKQTWLGLDIGNNSFRRLVERIDHMRSAI